MNNRSAVNRRASQNKRSGGRVVQTRNMIETSEARLATRKDRCTMVGKVYFPLANSGAGYNFPLTTDAFGTRVAAVANQFSRWKIERLIVKIAPPYATSTGIVSASPMAVGFIDDVSGEGGSVQLPTTQSEILTLRCSTLQIGTEPNLMKWNPIELSKWYYTEAGGTGTDPRFVVPASLCYFIFGTGVQSALEVHYTIVFEGAKQSST